MPAADRSALVATFNAGFKTKLTLATLAAAMHQAGIVQGMELDVHAAMVSFDIEQPGANGVVNGKRLLGSMNSPANHYLIDDQRDFFYVAAS